MNLRLCLSLKSRMPQTYLSRCLPEVPSNLKPVCDSLALYNDASLETQHQAVIVCMPGTCCSVDNKTLAIQICINKCLNVQHVVLFLFLSSL